MYLLRFEEEAPLKRSLDQLRGMEAVRVKAIYKNLSMRYQVEWHGRPYDPQKCLLQSDLPNICLSAANSCLYGVTEAAILAAGYAPALGFLHSGKPKSFVYDIADLVKFETVSPVAFRVAKENPGNPERAVRIACRDVFRSSKLLKRLVPLIEDVLTIEGVSPPKVAPDTLPIAFEDEEVTGDVGHHS